MDEKQSQQGLDLGLFINDQYVTVKKIGQGAFGVVWQAYDFSLRNFIAVKELLSEYSEPKFVEMFYKEALIAKNIIHDNIVRVQHFWKGNNGSYYITLDFVRGIDLEDLLRRCSELRIRMPWELSVIIAISMLKALDYANRVARDSITGKPYGIVYRDVSPGNVLISFDGNVKLSDFGVAKTADEIKEGIKQKVITGKYPYMSPEQMRGDANLDHRTDIFSTGVVFYEMITGKPLFTGENSEIKSQVLNEKFDTGALAGLNIPYEISEILSKSLEKDRELRYEKAIEMYRDLRRLLKGIEAEELAVDLSSFISKIMEKELSRSDNVTNLVKTLDRNDIKNNQNIPKILCNDFIVGEDNVEHPAASQQFAAQAQSAAGSSQQRQQTSEFQPQHNAGQPQPQVEAKGKTVFEEVGDWLASRFKSLKSKIIKIAAAFVLAVIIFAALDIFMQLTPFGKNIYSRVNPPDVVITTIPSGATVSMKTRDNGETVIQNASSAQPISLRKVQPQTYIVTALKEGFKPVQRVVRIEERTGKSSKAKQEKIEIMFDFMLDVNSEPPGADVYIDGNKFGVTPCKVQLVAGEHTVRLALVGYEDLGSKAKEAIEGQCNIDFSRANADEMFGGVDKKYWNTELKKIDGENVFSIKGHMYKRFTFKSLPAGMIVHIDGESRPRGRTPITANIKNGNYKVRIMDPDGRYGQAEREISVTAASSSELSVNMNKLIRFSVYSKNKASESFTANLNIKSSDFNTARNISTGKTIVIPLPTTARYTFTFTAQDFKPYVIRNVDITEASAFSGLMEYDVVPLNLKVFWLDKDGLKIPLEAYVYINEKIVGKTDKNGFWTSKYDPGSIKGKIISDKFISQDFEVILQPGKALNHELIMVPEVIELPEPPPIKEEPKPKPKSKPKPEPKQKQKDVDVIVCPNCGYINTVPAGRKLRFCVNCAKPLK
ncbi:MAG: PEGA domain-containing protein [Endomicrobium sp.]|jgi:serine/threonine protein kinase|nr:PEGA domain-containing protein [Endomicrobium sp.]